jgi:hypothetical protein
MTSANAMERTDATIKRMVRPICHQDSMTWHGADLHKKGPRSHSAQIDEERALLQSARWWLPVETPCDPPHGASHDTSHDTNSAFYFARWNNHPEVTMSFLRLSKQVGHLLNLPSCSFGIHVRSQQKVMTPCRSWVMQPAQMNCSLMNSSHQLLGIATQLMSSMLIQDPPFALQHATITSCSMIPKLTVADWKVQQAHTLLMVVVASKIENGALSRLRTTHANKPLQEVPICCTPLLVGEEALVRSQG